MGGKNYYGNVMAYTWNIVMSSEKFGNTHVLGKSDLSLNSISFFSPFSLPAHYKPIKSYWSLILCCSTLVERDKKNEPMGLWYEKKN